MTDLTYEQWRDTYKPYMEDNDVRLFDFTGNDGMLIDLIPTDHIWTLIDDGSEDENGYAIEFLVSGKHLVNRIGYVVVEKSCLSKELTAGW